MHAAFQFFAVVMIHTSKSGEVSRPNEQDKHAIKTRGGHKFNDLIRLHIFFRTCTHDKVQTSAK